MSIFDFLWRWTKHSVVELCLFCTPLSLSLSQSQFKRGTRAASTQLKQKDFRLFPDDLFLIECAALLTASMQLVAARRNWSRLSFRPNAAINAHEQLDSDLLIKWSILKSLPASRQMGIWVIFIQRNAFKNYKSCLGERAKALTRE